uniref:phospholipase D n=2 Tax=Candidatus Bipolaricaulota TaxID=67810 RepID=H5SJS4_9BACT|nr:phospholipase D/transphosphatidylase [uncultured Acetothermia bacterium]BAL59492.1 phospholipase D/transphosphatidylase [Candidatus Acetothermum autotrophicum]
MRKIVTTLMTGVLVGFVLGWLASSYSNTERQLAPIPQGFSAPSAPISVYFAPSPEPEKAIIQALRGAQQSVHAALYQLTDPEIAQELIDTFRRGVALEILLDDEPSKGSKGCLLLSAGIPIKQYVDTGIMHHKFAVIDGRWVITGSYNWTTSAQTRNEENLLLIESPELAQAFEGEFQKLWAHKKSQALTRAACSPVEE